MTFANRRSANDISAPKKIHLGSMQTQFAHDYVINDDKNDDSFRIKIAVASRLLDAQNLTSN